MYIPCKAKSHYPGAMPQFTGANCHYQPNTKQVYFTDRTKLILRLLSHISLANFPQYSLDKDCRANVAKCI